jgi:DNA-binding response OmpR family regulator
LIGRSTDSGVAQRLLPPVLMADNNRVLVVEDEPNALSGYVEFLTAAGFEPSGTGSGGDALPLALANPPAAIVTDITLPGMNGFELAAALRNDPRTWSIPIIGLTAHWTTEVHTRARDVAMQVILAKPCNPAHLVAELVRVLDRAKALHSAAENLR